MLKRTATGALIAGLTYLALYFSGIPQVAKGFAAVLCAFAVYEIFCATGRLESEGTFVLTLLAAFVLLYGRLPYEKEIIAAVFCGAAVAALLLMIFHRRCRLDRSFQAAAISAAAAILFRSFITLRSLENGGWYLTFAVTLCFVTDIFAYLTGRFLGRHKLIPAISPNKTVEGAVGGTVCAVLAALAGGLLLSAWKGFAVDLLLLAGYALPASLIGQWGDLAMSAVKRCCHIKDFGTLLPGHGGILDRFDSALLTIPFTYLFCSITGGYIL